MSTGTIIMIVCAILYGLIVVLFKDESHVIKEDESILEDPLFVGADGTPGTCGLLADDLDLFKLKEEDSEF